MNAATAFASLRELRVLTFETSDAAARLGVSGGAANKLLGRLARAGLLVRVRRGLWAFDANLDPLLLPERLSAPFPSYVSLQTALYLHGMVDQIPAVIYAVTLSHADRISTHLGTFSFHHVAPPFFGGFEPLQTGVKLATPEKALIDILYLSSSRTRLFASLPELEIPPRFRPAEARRWIATIEDLRRRARVEARLSAVLAVTQPSHG